MLLANSKLIKNKKLFEHSTDKNMSGTDCHSCPCQTVILILILSLYSLDWYTVRNFVAAYIKYIYCWFLNGDAGIEFVRE